MRWFASVPLTVVVALFGAGSTAARTGAVTAGLPRVTLIGDSVAGAVPMYSSARKILVRDLDVRFEVAACRRVADESCSYQGVRPPTAVDVVKRVGRGLGPTVIVAVGYNDPGEVYAREIQEALRALAAADVQRVLWVTLRAADQHYAAMNAMILAAAANHPEMAVVDWNLYSSPHAGWFASDGLHLTEAGADAMAALFHATLTRLGVRGPALRLVTSVLPPASINRRYAVQLRASGGKPPYRWTRGAGFPSWLSVSARGLLSGTPRLGSARLDVVVRVQDSAGEWTSRRFVLRVEGERGRSG